MGTSTPLRNEVPDQQTLDIAGLNLQPKEEEWTRDTEEPPKIALAREKLLEVVRKTLEKDEEGRKGVSLVVVGHVDAGKSTLMGRLLYELGQVDEKTRVANERGSSKAGKSSFSWAWELDGTTEERSRGITMDIALQHLPTPHRLITILDAPGHKDFIPNMISGASQADCALLVVDATTGEFEAGFSKGGQTREHLLLVRSLGVGQVVVAVNKMDQVNWSQARYIEIFRELQPFLLQSGFQTSKTAFVPVGAMSGVNLVNLDGPDAAGLREWYEGPSLVDLLDRLDPPTRDITSPLRMPISNVFREQGSGLGVSGKICGGVVQVGEKVRVMPGDEIAVVKSIDSPSNLLWSASGTNTTLFLTSIDPIHLHIGSVLCSVTEPVRLATKFKARIIVFEVAVPIVVGASVEVFHHSRDVPATISKLCATLDRTTGAVIKTNPRVLTKHQSAEIEITLRGSSPTSSTFSSTPTASSTSTPASSTPLRSSTPTGAGADSHATTAPVGTLPRIPLEPFSVNKDMGRVLVRRGGETIGAGIVLEILA